MGRSRRATADQIALFVDIPEQVTRAAERVNVAGYGGTSDLVPVLLADIPRERYALMDPDEQVVALDGDGRCRHADADITAAVESLIAQRYATSGDLSMQRHGAILKRTYLVKLTNSGDRLRRRWAHLAGIR